jgi:hypothetical protein
VSSNGNLIAGSHARRFDGALQPLGGVLVAFAALPPYAWLQLVQGAHQHVGARHAQQLLLYV